MRRLDYVELALIFALVMALGTFAFLTSAPQRIARGIVATVSDLRPDIERYDDGSIAFRLCLPGASDDCGA